MLALGSKVGHIYNPRLKGQVVGYGVINNYNNFVEDPVESSHFEPNQVYLVRLEVPWDDALGANRMRIIVCEEKSVYLL